MIQRIQRYATAKTAFVGFGVLILTQVFLASYVIPSIQSRHPEAVNNGTLIMMDFQPLATPEEEYRVLNLYTPDIVGYVQMLYATDFILPLSATFLFLGLIGVMLKYVDEGNQWRWLLL